MNNNKKITTIYISFYNDPSSKIMKIKDKTRENGI